MHNKKSKSAFALILANIITIGFAVVQQWDLSTVVWTYWSQSIVIGVFQFIKILTLKKFSTKGMRADGEFVPSTLGTKMSVAFFFLIHYGIFHFIYFSFLTDRLPTPVLSSIYMAIGVFVINHLYSYFVHKCDIQNTVPNIQKLASAPYSRIIPMHFFVMLSVFLIGKTAIVLGGEMAALVSFMTLKTIADVNRHNAEHKKETKK